MKKIILIILLFCFTLNADAVIRVKYMNQAASQMIVQNYAGFPYSYDQFQIAINNQIYILAALLVTGTLVNMAANGTAVLSLPFPPESLAGASVSIWYPGSLPANATTFNLVDFLEYGSSGNPYETVAVQAGTWTLGAFISSPFPIVFNGGINDYGTQFYSSFVGIDTPANTEQIVTYPNPCIGFTTVYIPSEFSKNKKAKLELYDTNGKLMDSMEVHSELTNTLDTQYLPAGIYYLKLTNAAKEEKTLELVKN